MNKVNYQLEMERVMSKIPAGERLFMQVCCGPCASVVLERLSSAFELGLYFYNPNIWPKEEYDLRKCELESLVRKMPLDNPAVLVASVYDPERFAQMARGLEDTPEGGARCAACFRLRLEQTATQAAALGYGWFGTTLTVGPRKNPDVINAIGRQAGEKYGVQFLPADFKKKEGYKRSIELCREYGVYRQHYCGCRFSLPNTNEEPAPKL